MKQVFNPLSGSFDLVEDQSAKIKYTPTVEGDFEAQPTEVKSALDQIASRKNPLDIFVQLQAREDLGDWSTGDNATFLGGGTLAGTFEKETSSPLNGVASYKYTQAASSLDDYIASPSQPVPLRFRGQTCSINFPFNYNGSNSDINLVIYDDTNNVELYNQPIEATNGGNKILKANFIMPLTCANLIVGFHVKVLDSGKILNFDDIQVSDDTLKYTDISNISEWQSYTPTFAGFGTVSTSNMAWRKVGANIEVRGRFTTGTPTATEARISFPLNYLSISNITNPNIVGVFAKSTGPFSGSFNVLTEPSVGYFTFGISGASNTGLTKLNGNGFIVAGEDVSLFASIPIAGLLANSPSIITPIESFSSDTAQFTYAGSSQYTLATLPNSPIGTFITGTYAASTNTLTQTNAAPPTQTVADMNVNGIRVFSRAYNAASTSGNPAYIAINIGKGFKGHQLSLYKSVGKATSGSLDYMIQSTNSYQTGVDLKGYNEATGIFLIDLGYKRNTTITSHDLSFEDRTQQTDGYLVINASKSPALVGVPELIPRIATISDVKASGSFGGTFTSGSYQTRVLNTLDDPTGIVTSLTSNQFILPIGEYNFEIFGTAYRVGIHKLKLRNITDSTDALIGSTQVSGTADSTTSVSYVSGKVVLAAPKTFELQHRCTTTVATNGFGDAAAFGDTERYSEITITKVK